MNWGTIIKIALKFPKSELGQTLKSSSMYNIVATHRNWSTSESKLDFLANNINTPAIINNIILDLPILS